jgi:hypothetical protein
LIVDTRRNTVQVHTVLSNCIEIGLKEREEPLSEAHPLFYVIDPARIFLFSPAGWT